MDKPSIGRTVHYVSYGSPIQADGSQKFKPECRAAIVTEVDYESENGRVGLAVFNPSGTFFHTLNAGGCEFKDGAISQLGGTWHWPERVS